VDEMTAYVDFADEMTKLLRRAELARAKYSRGSKKIMIVPTAKRNVAKEMERIVEEGSEARDQKGRELSRYSPVISGQDVEKRRHLNKTANIMVTHIDI
jgi:hypothetical protein